MDTSPPSLHLTLFPRQHVRRQVGKTLGHLAPALILALGIAPLVTGQEPLTLLASLEVLVGSAYLVLMIRELRHLRHQPFQQERIAWLELAAAAILGVEAYHLWHRHHAATLTEAPQRIHLLPWLYVLVAGLYVVLAFRLQALTHRRFLHLSAEGFRVRTRFFAPVQQVRWAELATLEPVGAEAVHLSYRNGHHAHLTFEGLHAARAHRDRLLASAPATLRNHSSSA